MKPRATVQRTLNAEPELAWLTYGVQSSALNW
jgi:hypothetical protein